jgi:hypothetical protein
VKTTQENPYVERTGYISAANGENGWFYVFDRSRRDGNKWRSGTHQWLVMKMPNGPEMTTRTRDEAVKLAAVSRRYSQRFSSVVEMTGEQSRQLDVGDRVCWQNNRADQGTVTEKNWAGVTIKWDNRSEQTILHNDMAQVEQVPVKA